MLLFYRMFPYYKKTDYRISVIYFCTLAAILVWCAAAISVPFLRQGSALESRSAGLITFFFAPVCHQMPDRCFHLVGQAMPLCSRCSGIYLGALSGVLFFPVLRNKFLFEIPKRRVLIFSLLPLLLEVSLSKIGLYDGGLIIRFISGLIPGAVSVFYVLPSLNKMISKKEV